MINLGYVALALGWTVGYVFVRDGIDVFPRIGLVVMWLIGVGITGLSAMLVLQMAGRLPVRGWEQTGLS